MARARGTMIRAAVTTWLVLALMSVATPAAAETISSTPDVTHMTDGAVRALLRYGDHIYIGGQFTKVRSTPLGTPGPSFDAAGLARIDASTGEGDPSWTPDVTWGSFSTTQKPTVWAIAAAGGKIWFGGDFGAVNGLPRTNFAAVDAVTGAVDPSVTAAVGELGAESVRAMVATPSTVFVGGFFAKVDGIARRRLAAFSLAGALSGTWKAKVDKRVFSMALDCTGSSLFVGGQFRQAAATGGAWQARETIARFDLATGALLPWAIPLGTIENDQKAYDLAPTCSQLNVAYGGRNYAAAFSLTSNTGTQLWRKTTSGNVQTVAATATKVVIGGHFSSVDRITRTRIAALSMASGAVDPSWHPAVEGQWGGPWALLVSDNRLYVGGQFTTVAGVARNFFARFTLS